MASGRYLEDHGDRLLVRPSPDDALALGATLAFVCAPSTLLAASFAAGVVAGGAWDFLVGWLAGAALSSVLAVTGLAIMATARRRASKRTVRIDLAERLIDRPGRALEVLRGVTAIRVRSRGLGFALELAHEGGRATPLIGVPRGEGRALVAAAEHLADALGVEVEAAARARAARPLVPRSPRLAGALCYVPLDGLFVAASVWYLMTSTDPFVRFNAKQSLALFGLSAVLALFLAGCCGLPFASLLPEELQLAAFVSPLVTLVVARIVVRTIAAMRAHRGIVWIQPWLAPLSARWAPPPEVRRTGG